MRTGIALEPPPLPLLGGEVGSVLGEPEDVQPLPRAASAWVLMWLVWAEPLSSTR